MKYPVSSIHILKCHGLSLLDSRVEPGYALNCVRAAQGMPTSIKNAKIACLDINLQRYKLQMGVQVRAVGEARRSRRGTWRPRLATVARGEAAWRAVPRKLETVG